METVSSTSFQSSTNINNRIIRLPDVIERTGLSRSSIYDRMKYNVFPKPVSLGGRSVGWLEREVDAWIEAKITARPEQSH